MDTLKLAQRLTDRDRSVLRLLERHRVLTTPQITEAAFSNQHTATQRMRVLTALGLVARFRPRIERGSAPWHYVLDSYGAAALAAERGADADQVRVRRDRQLALASSSQLGHRLGVAGFFTALLAHERRSDGRAQLVRSLDAAEVSEWVASYTGTGSGPRPDAGGHWREDGQTTRFLLEYDTGSEPRKRLVAKLDRYADFVAELRPFLADEAPIQPPWLLFSFPTAQRETSARAALSSHESARSLPVATTYREDSANPAHDVWRPLADDARMRLAYLPAPVSGKEDSPL